MSENNQMTQAQLTAIKLEAAGWIHLPIDMAYEEAVKKVANTIDENMSNKSLLAACEGALPKLSMLIELLEKNKCYDGQRSAMDTLISLQSAIAIAKGEEA